MAVYTHITRAQLDDYWRAFDLPPIADFQGIPAGVSNTNYRVTMTDGTRLILTLFEARTPRDDLPYFINLMEHLAARGIICPRPILDKDGAALHRLADRPAAMVSFLSGHSVLQPETPHCAAIGSGLAQLHRAGADFPATRSNSMGRLAWRDLLRESADGSPIHAAAWRLAEEFCTNWPRDLPTGAIHADLFPDNAFFNDRQQLSGIIDFYFACHDYLAYDLAITINAWCALPNGQIDTIRANAMVSAYQSIRKLTQAEIIALPKMMQAAALRIFATRHYDWFNWPPQALLTPKDPGEYAKILTFHQDNPAALQDWLA